jgi:hypothetical protein
MSTPLLVDPLENPISLLYICVLELKSAVEIHELRYALSILNHKL